LRDLKENYSSFDGMQSLEYKLSDIEDTFRNPNLLLQTINEMQTKQEKSLKEIQSKLNEINQVKENLKVTNEFKPNLIFNQEEGTSLFGSIELSEYSDMNSLKSQILTDQQSIDLIRLCEFSHSEKWTVLYRATRDGFGSDDFHSKCDGHFNTLTLFRAKQTKFIFGGFTAVAWESPTDSKWEYDRNAFIFSLTNKDNQPVKMKIHSNSHEYAILCYSKFGPIFGGGPDIFIADNAKTTTGSYSHLGFAYPHPQYAFETNEAMTFLAGSFEFQLDEIEVYQKE
jgi:hypothetical protein